MKFLVVLACLVSVAVASGIIGSVAVGGPVAVGGYGLGRHFLLDWFERLSTDRFSKHQCI